MGIGSSDGDSGLVGASEAVCLEARLQSLDLEDFVRAVRALAHPDAFPAYDIAVMAKTGVNLEAAGNRDSAVIAESPSKPESAENHDSPVRGLDVR